MRSWDVPSPSLVLEPGIAVGPRLARVHLRAEATRWGLVWVRACGRRSLHLLRGALTLELRVPAGERVRAGVLTPGGLATATIEARSGLPGPLLVPSVARDQPAPRACLPCHPALVLAPAPTRRVAAPLAPIGPRPAWPCLHPPKDAA
jgi:hypothetical protein